MYQAQRQSYQVRIGPPSTPPVIKKLIIINVVVFLAQTRFPSLTDFGAAWPIFIWTKGRLWQIFTYMWLHGGFLHIFMNMFALWMFGSPLASYWGSKRFIRFYLVCGTGAGAIIAAYPYILYFLGIGSPRALLIPTLGASGAIFGVLLAYSFTWPNRTLMLIFPPIPFKAIWLIPLLFLMTAVFSGKENISHSGHLGGVIVGYLYLKQMGYSGGPFDLGNLKNRWRRYKLRKQLYEVKKKPFDDDHNDHRTH